MNLLQALKRAISLEKKGGFVAVLPAYGGLPPRVAMKREGFWASWILDEPIEAPGAVLEVAELQNALKYKPMAWQMERVLAMPNALHVTHGNGMTTVVKCTPCMTPQEWCPPWPAVKIEPVPQGLFDGALQLVHAVADDELRPELNCVCFAPSGVYAGDEAQFAWLGLTLGQPNPVLMPSHAFHKWPSGESVGAFFTHDRAYVQIGEELRVVALSGLKWWPTDVVDAHRAGGPHLAHFDLTKKAFLEPFKLAKRIAERRMVALGLSGGAPWIHVGEGTLPLQASGIEAPPGVVWQVVLDGNRLLDLLKSWPADFVRVEFSPTNPRAPVSFMHPNYFEALYPMIPIE